MADVQNKQGLFECPEFDSNHRLLELAFFLYLIVLYAAGSHLC